MIIKNDSKEVERALHLDEGSVKASENFIFTGKLNNHQVMVITEPADEEQRLINISSVEIAAEPTNETEKDTTAMKKQAEGIEVIITEDTRYSNCWVNGKVTDLNGTEYIFNAKVYNEGSRFGINQGRVSKLNIRNSSEQIVNYDRGWDIKPAPEHKRIYKAVMQQLKTLSKVGI